MSQYTFDALTRESQIFRAREAKRKIALLQELYDNTSDQPDYQTAITAVNSALDTLISTIID